MVHHKQVAQEILRLQAHRKEVTEDQAQAMAAALNLLAAAVVVRLLLDRMRLERHQVALVDRERLVQLPAQVLPAQVVAAVALM
jgi:hypothetical protein